MTRASWPEVRLGDYSDIQMGFAFKSKDFSEQEVGPRLLLGANVAPGRADWGKLRFWPAAELEDLDRYQLAAGDVVLAMDRPWIPAGLKVLRIDSADLPCLLVQRVARLRGSESLDTRFLYLLLSHPAFTVYILGVQTGSTVPHISGRQIAD